ncbi:endoplasmic reticulum-based factor for assembly of V-ATPase-domain-containing protein [Dactylonectria estremocensis]|uniref:Endoplasmic reticulum-based factor for assembly of V-ATPase-domain-containing protein n=1 Tax=Dactylonectria estremocensis TaxID=1079267 RepID=A0A9P9FD48_9HYPO|nr:endoplasmic reticulum-based factor for assembly of V-ATPase-domain-containing protein [Dactylonectria estremocensis]
MVLLTMTPSIVEALTLHATPKRPAPAQKDDETTPSPQVTTDEPSLDEPTIGKPISHGQIVDLWRNLKSQGDSAHSLEQLLRGANVYISPPPPKPEPSPQYKALMARLRRDEEARAYERMMNPHSGPKTFHDRFPSAAHAFAEANKPTSAEDLGDDSIFVTQTHREVTLILNFLASIAGVAGTLWVVARWWNTPARLFLTLGGSILVAIAEVVVYNAYLWRMGESKKKQKKVEEVKEVLETWVVGPGDDTDPKTIIIQEKEEEAPDTVRKRHVEAKTET